MNKQTINNNSGSLRLLFSLDSYKNRDDASGVMPNVPSVLLTTVVVLALLVASEVAWRQLFIYIQHWHPLLDIEMNRHILARHIGVDVLSCTLGAILGWHNMINQQAGHTIPLSMVKYFLSNDSKSSKKQSLSDYQAWPAVEKRVYGYQPAACRLCLFFIIYQIKNLHDTIVWKDGPEFVLHHIFSIITAWGGVGYGCLGYYTYFYFGVSEISTAVLCMLANFDDDHGVIGLGDALPMFKAANATVFVILFITCRCILWPKVSYYFVKDCWQALDKLKNDEAEQRERIKGVRVYIIFFMVSLSCITVLQVAWLGEIFGHAKVELAKAGFEF